MPGFGHLDTEDLLGEVPLVDGRTDIQPFITLQPDQPAAQGLGEDLGHFRFPHPGLALEQQGFFHTQGQKNSGGQAAVTDIFLFLERPVKVIDRLERFCLGCGFHFAHDRLNLFWWRGDPEIPFGDAEIGTVAFHLHLQSHSETPVPRTPACSIISKNNGRRACANSGSLTCPSNSLTGISLLSVSRRTSTKARSAIGS